MADSLSPSDPACGCDWCAAASGALPTKASEPVIRAILTHCRVSRVRAAARVRFVAMHMERVRGVSAMPPPVTRMNTNEPEKGRPLGRPFLLSANLNDGGTDAA